MDSDVETPQTLELCFTHSVKTPPNPQSNKYDNTQITNHPTTQTINKLQIFQINMFWEIIIT